MSSFKLVCPEYALAEKFAQGDAVFETQLKSALMNTSTLTEDTPIYEAVVACARRPLLTMSKGQVGAYVLACAELERFKAGAKKACAVVLKAL